MTGGEIQTDERFDIRLEIICEFVNWHVDGDSCLRGTLHKYRMSHILNGLFSLCILPPLALYVKKLGICLLAIWIQIWQLCWVTKNKRNVAIVEFQTVVRNPRKLEVAIVMKYIDIISIAFSNTLKCTIASKALPKYEQSAAYCQRCVTAAAGWQLDRSGQTESSCHSCHGAAAAVAWSLIYLSSHYHHTTTRMVPCCANWKGVYRPENTAVGAALYIYADT